MILEPNFDRIAQEITSLQEQVAQIHLNPKAYGIDKALIIKEKGAKDYTNTVDIAVERLMKPVLLGMVDSGFLGEETGTESLNRRYVWIVDPTDGTAVFTLGGEYYSNSAALLDRTKKQVVLCSVYQSATGRQFLMTPDGLVVRERIERLDGKMDITERKPRKTNSECFAEGLACSFGTSKYYSEHPGIKERLEAVFENQEVPELKRFYSISDAKPASGSSALFNCDIADGNRHFALLFFQKAWDMAGGAIYAERAGCPVIVYDNNGKPTDQDLDSVIAGCDKNTLINVGVFGNEFIQEYVMQRF